MGELRAKPGEGVNGTSAAPSVPGLSPRSTSPEEVEDLEPSNCAPKGELSAKPTEGVYGTSAASGGGVPDPPAKV
jgi:hypothetical protein